LKVEEVEETLPGKREENDERQQKEPRPELADQLQQPVRAWFRVLC
jgi:hypothetical protein